ncbi:hypothetical protein [Mycolicibacterium frederiksbergense]|nr:hypothetical protein [Mycolicibacterium frederiksbergense]
MALTAAGTLALAPVVLPVGERSALLPIVSAPDIRLSAVIDPADVQALIANLYSTLDDVTQTVAAVSLVPGNSIVDVLTRANAVNGELWNGLINATDSVQLRGLLAALGSMSTNNFSELIATVDALNIDIAMLPAQISETIGFAVTGSLTAALGALTNLINQPLAASSYTGLASSALQQVIVAGEGVLQTVDWIGQAGFGAANTIVDGLWQQVPGALSGLNDVLSGAAEQSDSAVVDAVIATVQGLAIAPAYAASSAALRLASSIVGTGWDGFDTGMKAGAWALAYPIYAVQDALKTVGDKPLDPASYTRALAQLIGGGFNVGNTLVTAGSDLLTLSTGLAKDLNVNVADTIAGLSDAVGEMASAVLHAAGLPSDVAALPKALTTEVTAAVRATQKFVDTNLISPVDSLIANGEHALIDASSAVQGAINKALGATDLPDPNTRTEWGYHPFSAASDGKAAVSGLKSGPVAEISVDPGTEPHAAPIQGDVLATPSERGVLDTNIGPAGSAAAVAQAVAGDTEKETESPAPAGRHRIGATERGVSVDSLLKRAREAKKAEREDTRAQLRERLNLGQRHADGKRDAVKNDRGTGMPTNKVGAQGKTADDTAA